MQETALAANRAVAFGCVDLGERENLEPNPSAMTPTAVRYQGFALLSQDRRDG
jgi:hypothetical protein